MAAKAAAARRHPTPVLYPPYQAGPKSAAGPKRRRRRRYDDGEDDDADSDADIHNPGIQRGPQAVKTANKARHAKLPTVLSLEDVHADARHPAAVQVEVMDRVGVSFPTLWKWMRAQPPTFPRARALGGTTVWIASEVEAWMASLPLRPLKGD